MRSRRGSLRFSAGRHAATFRVLGVLAVAALTALLALLWSATYLRAEGAASSRAEAGLWESMARAVGTAPVTTVEPVAYPRPSGGDEGERSVGVPRRGRSYVEVIAAILFGTLFFVGLMINALALAFHRLRNARLRSFRVTRRSCCPFCERTACRVDVTTRS